MVVGTIARICLRFMVFITQEIALSWAMRLHLLDLPWAVNGDLKNAQTTTIARIWHQQKYPGEGLMCTYGGEVY
jgi:hypothetical protein